MIAEIALLASIVTFPGGSTADLAEHVAKATGRNIFISQGYVQPVKKFDYETKTYEDLGYYIRMNGKLHLVPAADLIFCDDMLPPFRMPTTTIGKGAPPPRWKEPGPGDIREGKVTFGTAGSERFNPARLAGLGFTKPVIVNWILDGVQVAVQVDKLGEQAFLDGIAKSVGGKLVVDKDTYRIDLDPEPFRKRVVNMLTLRRQSDPPSPDPAEDRAARLELLAEIFGEVDGKTLVEAFKTPEGRATTTIDTRSSVVSKVIAEMKSGTGATKFVDPNRFAIQTPGGIAYLDPRNGVTLEIRANFTASVTFNTVDAQGKAGPKLSLEIQAG